MVSIKISVGRLCLNTTKTCCAILHIRPLTVFLFYQTYKVCAYFNSVLISVVQRKADGNIVAFQAVLVKPRDRCNRSNAERYAIVLAAEIYHCFVVPCFCRKFHSYFKLVFAVGIARGISVILAWFPAQNGLFHDLKL